MSYYNSDLPVEDGIQGLAPKHMPGKYKAKVVEVEEYPTKRPEQGEFKLNVSIVCWDMNNEEGPAVKYNNFFPGHKSDFMRSKLDAFLRVLGCVDSKNNPALGAPKDLIGRSCIVVLGYQKDRPYLEVKGWFDKEERTAVEAANKQPAERIVELVSTLVMEAPKALEPKPLVPDASTPENDSDLPF